MATTPKKAGTARRTAAPTVAAIPLHATLKNHASTMSVPAGRAVFRQGSLSDAVFFLRAGTAKASVLSKSGQEAVILILGAGDFFGEGCIYGSTRRLATVTTITPCIIDRIPVGAMRQALRDEPHVALMLLENVLKQNRRFLEDIVDHHFHSTEKRLARALLRLTNIDRGHAREESPSGVSQAMLADMIGTTRSHVNFFMNKFRRLGMIHYSGRLDGNFIVHRSLAGILSGE
jgi:CRP/FNR family transcriptional regulator, cyclic AMP receptor protein